MSPVADLGRVACGLATTAATTLRATLGAPGHFEASPPGPVRVRASHLVVLVPTRGDLTGVTWVLPVAAAAAFARRMAPSLVADPALIAASACELANILTGRASAMLELCGVHVELTSPRVVQLVAAGPSACVGCDLGTLTVSLHEDVA